MKKMFIFTSHPDIKYTTIVCFGFFIFGICISLNAGADERIGKYLYQQNCASCHGKNALGHWEDPNLIGGPLVSDSEIATKLKAYKYNRFNLEGIMFRAVKQYSYNELDDIAEYVESLTSNLRNKNKNN